MSDIAPLTTHARPGTGSRAARKLRKHGLIPAVVYGHKEAVAHIAVDRVEFDRAVRVKHARAFTLTIDGKADTVLLKDLQWDHLGSEMVHADFLRVSATERVKVVIPVELRGTPKSMGGGVLDQPLHRVHVECPATAIPDAVRYDITNLTLGSPVHVRDLVLPAGVTVLDPPEAVVVHLKVPGAETAVPEATAAEPEVLSAKKPKDDDAAPAKK